MSSSAAFPPASLQPLLTELTALLRTRRESVCVAETAAGGLISACLLSQPGASSYYKGGLTLYTLPSRVAYAGWTPETIASYKGPTTEIVAGLARHARAELKATYSIGESGTAGPTASGEGRNRQPGYVAVAVDCEEGRPFVKEVADTGLGGDRAGNMLRFAEEALGLLRDVLKGEAKL